MEEHDEHPPVSKLLALLSNTNSNTVEDTQFDLAYYGASAVSMEQGT